MWYHPRSPLRLSPATNKGVFEVAKMSDRIDRPPEDVLVGSFMITVPVDIFS
jgi:hypothetical protein